jgi:hypothetical protein
MIFGVGPKELGVDWFGWGADHMVRSQKKDGSWDGKYGPDVDTCFALMFLSRANLVKDLSGLMGNRVLVAGKAKPPANPNAPGPKLVETPKGNTPAPTAPANVDPEAEKLARALVEANGAKQLELVKEYTETKGGVYTTALTVAIPQLSDEIKKKAREGLAERMARMSADTIRSRLKDENAELRRAAALAVAMREERTLIPDLITALEDPNELVSRAAKAALKDISGKDFGPAPGASPEDRAKAIAAWKEWVKSQK